MVVTGATDGLLEIEATGVGGTDTAAYHGVPARVRLASSRVEEWCDQRGAR
ncbi:hypothetical protein ACQPZQ_16010 [Pseudonocardia sp. CA-142604]|uniref:hypothetical protein n=1 Tax=Pseudonocardia sp. CA-142604 TaxID=3240024 RepID=UPI003D8B6B5F